MGTATLNYAGFDAAKMLNLGRTAVIASWWPKEKVVERRFRSRPDGGYYTAYTIPACPAEAKEPVLLTIGDALELHNLGGATVDGAKAVFREAPVPGGAVEIAKDIINATRGSAVGAAEGRHPGIWICASTEGPTPEECARWRAEQESYFRALVAQADDAHFQGHKQAISTLHRMAAEWLRLDTRKHEWVRAPQRGEIISCPFCRVQIDALSAKCSNCNEIVDQKRYDELKNVAQQAREYLAAEAPELIVNAPRPIPGKPPTR